MGHIYILATVLFTVYGQLVLKWRMGLKGPMPAEGFMNKIVFILHAYTDIWVLSCFGAGFLASMTWAAAVTHFELSYAYPFTTLSLVLVFLLSYFIYGESLNAYKIVGVAFIVMGVFFISMGK